MAQLVLSHLRPDVLLGPKSHYDYDPVGAALGLRGAGILAHITGDQLHPPMVDDEEMWRTGSWQLGAIRHVEDAAHLCELRPHDRVLDVGCGIGGASRILADRFGADVLGTNIANSQLETARELDRQRRNAPLIRYVVHDCQRPFPEDWGRFDVIWLMNMLYHIENADEMICRAIDSLANSGRIMIDDWMLTSRATDLDRRTLGYHFISPHFMVRERLVEIVAGLRLRIIRWVDLGHVGRTHLATHFRTVFDSRFRSLIEAAHGNSIADDFVCAIEKSISLYRQEKMTYVRMVAQKI